MSVLQKNKKVAAGVGITAVAAAALALGAGTYAGFVDNEAGPSGTFAAATLDLAVGGTIVTEPINFTNMEPGDTVSKTFSVLNTGSVAGNLTGTYLITGTENGCGAAETSAANYQSGTAPACTDPGSGDLAQALTVKVGNGPAVPLASPAGTLPFAGAAGPVTLPPSATPFEVTLTFTLPQGTDNRVQSDTASFTSTLTLEQTS